MKNKDIFDKVAKFALGIVSLLSTAISLYNFFSGEKVTSLIAISIALFFVMIFSLLTIKGMYDDYILKKIETGKVFHKYSHLLRDNIYTFENIIKNKKNHRIVFDNYISLFCSNVADLLSNYFKVLLNQTGNITIKCIDKKYWDNNKILIDRKDVIVETLARCVNSDHHRKHNDLKKHIISGDTSLTEIFINQKSDYYNLDIQKKAKKSNYLNSNSDYKDYYDNQLVVPIRIKNHIVDSSLPQTSGNNLIAFIIYDFKKRKISEKDVKYIFDYLKIVADSSYIIFDYMTKYYSEEIK